MKIFTQVIFIFFNTFSCTLLFTLLSFRNTPRIDIHNRHDLIITTSMVILFCKISKYSLWKILSITCGNNHILLGLLVSMVICIKYVFLHLR